MTHGALDIDHLRMWIGKSETAHDMITPRIVDGLMTTLRSTKTALPLTLHWCLAPPIAPMDRLGRDGHPVLGGLLPPVPLPRRMWAGSTLQFFDRLRVGDHVTRVSKVADVSIKQGRSGALCFVAVDHEISTDRGVAIRETQDIVYREAPKVSPDAARDVATSMGESRVPTGDWFDEVYADAVLLFRYSALTFNGHRIHYDREFCTAEEGYSGLVVHGPMQAAMMLQLSSERREEKLPKSFSFRGVKPLFDQAMFRINGQCDSPNIDQVWTQDANGNQCMSGKVIW